MSYYLNISVEDFDKICRTCASRGEMRNLYEKYIDNSQLIEILVKVTFLQIQENDHLPINICVNCEKQLIQAYKFAQKCSKVDLFLRGFLNDNDIKVEECIDKDPLEIDDWETKTSYETLEPVEQIKLEELDIKEEIDLTIDCDSEIEQIDTNVFVEELKPQMFECKKCFQEFPTEDLLKQHEKDVKHPVNKKIKCKICSKLIAYKHYRQHRRIHTAEKPFKCEICGTKFRVKSVLKNHILSRHTSQKPYKCNYCDQVFNRLWNLQSHERKHTGEKPYTCKFCKKDFKYPTSLRAHLKTHNK